MISTLRKEITKWRNNIMATKSEKPKYYDDMTVMDLFNLGAGFEDQTFLQTVFKEKVEIIRRAPENRYEEVFDINLVLWCRAQQHQKKHFLLA